MLSFLGEGCSEGVVLGDGGGNAGRAGRPDCTAKNVKKAERPQNEEHCRSAAPDGCLSDGLPASAPTVKYGERFARDSESRRVASECCARSV